MLRDPEGLEMQVIRELLGPSAGKVLEIGCGDGRLTAGIMAVSGSVFGLDPDHEALVKAHPPDGGGLMLVLGSGEDIPLADRSVDTVVFSLSLHHQDSARALGEARRILAPGGRVLVLEPVEHSLMTMLYALLQDESGDYERAEVAIRTSGLRELRSHAVRTRWVFEDFAEMTVHIFSHFGVEPDPERTDGMARILGGRRSSEPLVVEDITRYWLLEADPAREQVQVP